MVRRRIAGRLIGLAFWLNKKGLAGYNFEIVKRDMENLSGVKGVRNVHVWRIDNGKDALAAHILIADSSYRDAVKTSLKAMLENRYGISNAILECVTTDSGG